MEEPPDEPQRSSTKLNWSEAAGQAILLAAIAWALFSVTQAPWYMPTFDVRPPESRWFALTFLTGALPILLVLLVAFLVSWLVGALRRRPDPWQSYRSGLVIASLVMLLVNLGLWLGQLR